MKRYFVKNSKGELKEIAHPNKFRSLGYNVLVVEGVKIKVLKAFGS